MEFQLQKGQVSFVTEPTPRWIFSSPNRIDDRDLILFKDAISRVVKSLPGAIAYAQNLNCDGDNANQPDANEQILSLYQGRGDEGQILRMKNCLVVNVFNGTPNLWIKRMFFSEEKQEWYTCGGGFQICLMDEVDQLILFSRAILLF